MHRVILDTDLAMGAPGSDIDDGFALAMAHADPDLALELVTTVNGNTDVESATILTAELARRLDLDVRVVKGAAAALTRPQVVRAPAAHVDALRASVRPPAPGYAAAAIAEHVMANPGEITVVAIGPLTNVAAALSLEPRLAANVRELVVMGGVFFQTMPTRSMPGEFNVWVDPEAAQAVLRSGMPQRWVGLDVTLKVRLTREHARRLSASGTAFGRFAGDATLAWIEHVAAQHPGSVVDRDSCPVHDPLAVAVVTRPDLVRFREVALDVVTGEGPARGVMVTDVRESADPPPANARVATSVDVDGFTDHLLGLVGRL